MKTMSIILFSVILSLLVSCSKRPLSQEKVEELSLETISKWEGVYSTSLESAGYYYKIFALYKNRTYGVGYDDYRISDIVRQKEVDLKVTRACKINKNEIYYPKVYGADITQDKTVSVLSSVDVLYFVRINNHPVFMTEKGYQHYLETGKISDAEVFLRVGDIEREHEKGPANYNLKNVEQKSVKILDSKKVE